MSSETIYHLVRMPFNEPLSYGWPRKCMLQWHESGWEVLRQQLQDEPPNKEDLLQGTHSVTLGSEVTHFRHNYAVTNVPSARVVQILTTRGCSKLYWGVRVHVKKGTWYHLMACYVINYRCDHDQIRGVGTDLNGLSGNSEVSTKGERSSIWKIRRWKDKNCPFPGDFPNKLLFMVGWNAPFRILCDRWMIQFTLG